MGRHACRRVETLSSLQIFLLSVLGGAFIAAGALFATLLATGIRTPGVERLVEGFGFSAGFFFVILADAVLFTEANTVLPAAILRRPPLSIAGRIARFWVLAFIGNFAGAFLLGWAVHSVQHYPPDVTAVLHSVVQRKLQWHSIGSVGAWWQIVLSGILANWLVGMAAFFAVMGRTIFGRYIPIFLAVSVFVAANFQHSPANMGYYALIMPTGHGPGWGTAFGWSILPAALGNIAGGAILVAALLWYSLQPHERQTAARHVRAH